MARKFNIGHDVAIIAAALVTFGGAVALGVRAVWDWLLRRHRA